MGHLEWIPIFSGWDEIEVAFKHASLPYIYVHSSPTTTMSTLKKIVVGSDELSGFEMAPLRGKPPQAELFGLDAIWGDRKGEFFHVPG